MSTPASCSAPAGGAAAEHDAGVLIHAGPLVYVTLGEARLVGAGRFAALFQAVEDVGAPSGREGLGISRCHL